MATAMGLRLSEFCEALGMEQGAFRALLQTDSLPFFADTTPVADDREQSRRRYDGESYLAMVMAAMLREHHGCPLNRASEWIRNSRAANYFLHALGRREDVRDWTFARVVFWYPAPKRGMPHHAAVAREFGTGAALQEYLSRFVEGQDYVTHLALNVSTAYDMAVERARSNGFVLTGFELVRIAADDAGDAE